MRSLHRLGMECAFADLFSLSQGQVESDSHSHLLDQIENDLPPSRSVCLSSLPFDMGREKGPKEKRELEMNTNKILSRKRYAAG